MYKKTASWTVAQSWCGGGAEGVETEEKDYSYCLLLLELFTPKFVVVWTFSLLLFLRWFFFSPLLLCAISIDSCKVGKCRIACCSCLSTQKRKTKRRFENAQSTCIRQECLFVVCLLFVFLRLFSSTLGWKQTHFLSKLSSGGLDRFRLTIWQ